MGSGRIESLKKPDSIFGEIIVPLFVSGGEHSTLTRNMFNALRDQADPTIAAIPALIVASTSSMPAVMQFVGKPRSEWGS